MRCPKLAFAAAAALLFGAQAPAQQAVSAAEAADREAAADAARAAADASSDAAVASATVLLDSGRGERSRGSNDDPFHLSRDEITRGVSAKDPSQLYNATPQLKGWVNALKRDLSGSDLARASAKLATEYGIDPSAMQALVHLWLVADLHGVDIENGSADATRLRSEMIAAVGQARSAPIAEEIAAYAIDNVSSCDAAAFDALIAVSPNPAETAWRIVTVAPCPDNYTRFVKRFPQRSAAALIGQADWGSLEEAQALPLLAWLASDAGLAHVAVADRPAVHAWLTRNLAQHLFADGLEARAVALLDGLPTDERQRVLAEDARGFMAQVDGFEVSFDKPSGHSLALDLAAAYFTAGRRDEASALLAEAPELARAKAQFACGWQPPAKTDKEAMTACQKLLSDRDFDVDVLIVDRLLHDPGADPYPLAEAGFASSEPTDSDSAFAELRCRYFADPEYAGICRAARSSIVANITPDPDDSSFAANQRFGAVLEGLGLPGWQTSRDTFATDLAAVRTRYAGFAATDSGEARQSVDPITPPFALLNLPTGLRSAPERPGADSTAKWPRGWTQLPRGFVPIRWEKDGARAIAVSLSGLLDPSGEVSPGGYWVHLSDDGGKTWRAPLYTGLAANFPYVVPANSKLPLLKGDELQLEVAVELIDTASITYPPVALRTRKKQRDLFMEIPLADLSRDSDGDGLTDLVEQHLLLDRPPSSDGTPLVVGLLGDAGCSPADAGLRRLRAMLLGRITGMETGALVEPVDRPASNPLALGWRRIEQGEASPLFLKGDPADFTCMPAGGRLIIVYDEAEAADLKRRTPDFHLLEFPHPIMNRAGDRGFVRWSAGWTGGTLRIVRRNGEWQVEEIESWIT